MDSDLVQTTKQAYLGSLDPPGNFNDWLQGTHYAYQYAPQLDRTETTCIRALCASNAAMSERSGKTSRIRNPEKLRPKGSPAASDAISTPSLPTVPGAKELEKDGEATRKDSKGESSAKAEEQPASAAVSDASEKKSSRGKPKEKESTKPKNAPLLNSGQIRDHLRESYYQMKSVNAFGHTFPAWLTPLNRSVFHVYNEDELPRRGGWGGRRASPLNSSQGQGRSVGASGPVGNFTGDWKDTTGGMHSGGGRAFGYPYQNEVLNETCLNNLILQPGGPPAFYPSVTRPLRDTRKDQYL